MENVEAALAVIAQQHEQIAQCQTIIDNAVAGLVAEWAAENCPTATTASFKTVFGTNRVVIRQLHAEDGHIVIDWMDGGWPLRGLKPIVDQFTEQAAGGLMKLNPSRAAFELDLTQHRPEA